MYKMRLFTFTNPLDQPEAHYHHQMFTIRRRICRFLLQTIGFTLLAKVDEIHGLENIPAKGPAILMMNHIGFIDPLIMVNYIPRDIVPLAKVEAYDYPLVGIFPRIWGVIPVRRDGVDRHAIKLALEVLAAGEIVLVAPEGTRSPTLTAPREGAAYLASRSGAPIVPAALENTEGFPALPFSKRWRMPGGKLTIGRPFRVRSGLRQARGAQLTQIALEAMYRLAELLPPERRGEFADLSRATEELLERL